MKKCLRHTTNWEERGFNVWQRTFDSAHVVGVLSSGIRLLVCYLSHVKNRAEVLIRGIARAASTSHPGSFNSLPIRIFREYLFYNACLILIRQFRQNSTNLIFFLHTMISNISVCNSTFQTVLLISPLHSLLVRVFSGHFNYCEI